MKKIFKYTGYQDGVLSQSFAFIIGVLAFCVVIGTESCKKFLEIPPPNTSLVTSTVFSTDQTAQSAINGLYSYMYNNSNTFNGNLTYLPGMTGDELYYFQGSNYDQFRNNAISTNNILVDSLWKDPYYAIYQANAIIEGLQASSKVSPALKKQLTGESKFVRAFSYFYLVNMFGDVPLETTSNVNVNESLARSPKSVVIQQIVSDLTDAQNLLTSDYSYSNNERTRPNKWVATALLARVYLYKGDWSDAATQAGNVIANTSLYILTQNLNEVFLKNSSEAIWQFNTTSSSTDGFTLEGAHFIPGNGVPNYALTPFLLEAFEPGDNRLASWTRSLVYSGQTYYYPFKYKDASTTLSINGGEYYMVMRLAEQYLIRAECEANLNQLSEAAADLNTIRNRAGLSNTTASDKSTLLTSIAHERQVELFCEWGQRFFDLIRTNEANNILGTEKTNWKSTDALFPIPSIELQSNSKLTQNPGY